MSSIPPLPTKGTLKASCLRRRPLASGPIPAATGRLMNGTAGDAVLPPNTSEVPSRSFPRRVKRGGENMARESKVLKVGDKAPEFRLPDALTGKEVALGDLLGRPLLIYFGRGTW